MATATCWPRRQSGRVVGQGRSARAKSSRGARHRQDRRKLDRELLPWRAGRRLHRALVHNRHHPRHFARRARSVWQCWHRCRRGHAGHNWHAGGPIRRCRHHWCAGQGSWRRWECDRLSRHLGLGIHRWGERRGVGRLVPLVGAAAMLTAKVRARSTTSSSQQATLAVGRDNTERRHAAQA